MIYASCRRDFLDAIHFSDAPLMYRTDLNDPRASILEADAIKQMGPRPLVLVHGYRSSPEDVESSYSIIAAAVADFGYSAVVGMLWPGGELRISFPAAVPRANVAGKRLRSLLRAVPDADIQTHSLGARVALRALGPDGIVCKNLILSAPAVDDEALEYGEEFNGAALSCARVAVFHSQRDEVLRTAYRAGDLLEHDMALGWRGPENPDQCPANVHIFDCERVVGSHGGYRDEPKYYAGWRKVVDGEPLGRSVTLGLETM